MNHCFWHSALRFSGTRQFLVAALLVLSALFSFRLYNLDCDLPPFGISLYTSLDEGTYAAMALNKYNYGVVNCEALPIPSATPHSHRNNMIGNAVTYCSLRLFGDNYFGLRFPSVLWSFGTLLLMALILLCRLPKSRYRNLFVVAALAVPVLDFQFLVASRVVEPSVVRMFFVTLLATILVVPKLSCLSLFFAGFVAMVSVVLVYMTTAFVGLPLAVLLVLLIKRKKHAEVVSLVLGALTAFVLGEFYYKIVWHSSFFGNAVDAVSAFSKVGGYSPSSNALSVFKNVQSFMMNRCFVHCPPLLALLVLFLPHVVLKLLRRQILEVHVFYSFVVAFFFQTLGCNDYIARKFIVVYPLVVLGVAFSMTEGVAFWKHLVNRRFYVAFGDEASIARGRLYPVSRYAVVFAFIATLVLVFMVVHLPVFDVKPDKLDFKVAKDRYIYALFFLLPLLASMWLCLRLVLWRVVFAVLLVVSGWLTAGTLLSVKYVYGNPHYCERDFMLSLGDKDGLKRLFGEWSYAYTLYNDIKPVEGCYADLMAGIKADGGGWLINYEPTYIDVDVVNAATREGRALEPCIWLRHSFYTLGGYRDHVLYRVVPYSGENLALNPYIENYVYTHGYELPVDSGGCPFLPRELKDYLDVILSKMPKQYEP